MVSRLFAIGLLAAFAVLAGCSQDGETTPIDEASATGESELSSQRPRLLGLIDAGDVKSGSYYAPPQPRAWAFHAKGGDTLTIDVTSNVGDAIAYLTDDRYNVLAYNDDFRQATRDAQIVYTLPENIQVTSFRIVFEDYDARPAPFDVGLTVESGATCTYGSSVHHRGEQFPALDGCNTCSCGSYGVDCTKAVCACDPGSEPDKVYMYKPDDCLTVHVTCSAGLEPFSNECGCGCKRP